MSSPTTVKSIDGEPWKPGEWHATAAGTREWIVDGLEGIWVRDGTGAVGSTGAAGRRLVRKVQVDLPRQVWNEYSTEIMNAFDALSVNPRTIVACICTESGGDWRAERDEGFDRSMGLMQTLTNTAHRMGKLLGYPTETADDDRAIAYRMPTFSLQQNMDHINDQVKAWRRFLYEPLNSIMVGTKALAWLDKHYELQGDPVLLAAAYNAGGPYEDSRNKWGLRQHGPHCTTFAGFYSLACEVLG